MSISKFLKMFFFAFAMMSILVSCSKEEEDDMDEMEEYAIIGENFTTRDGDTGEEESGMDEEDEDEDEDENDEEGFEFDDDCFEFVYPFDLILPDGTTVNIEADSTLETIIEEFEDVNIDSVGIPIPAFPVSVILEDGTEAQIDSEEAFIELLVQCAEAYMDEEEDEEEEEDDDEDDEEDEDE